MNPGRLVLVPSPIGNLNDITLRALEVLKSSDVILAEDTRTSSHLLNHFSITKKLLSHHAFNEHNAVAGVISLLKAGQHVALLSDAGTPGIADPGFLLVRECIRQGIAVECLPGASALIPALINSGLPCDRFCFEGFLPHKKGRQTRLLALRDETRTMVFYESPFRVEKTLQQLAEVLGSERLASVSRELTKIYEETRRGTLTELTAHFAATKPLGEFVIVVAGKEKE